MDTQRSLAALQVLLRDNTTGDISPQDARDFLVSVYPTVSELTADATLTTVNLFVLCDASKRNITVTLPGASATEDKECSIKKIDSSANTVTVDGEGTETIDNGLTAVLTVQFESITIVSDGSKWHIR